MSKATKGPWEARIGEFDYADNVGSRPVIAGSEEDTRQICVVKAIADRTRKTPYNAPDEERDANARLIAAAPDLLEALERIANEEFTPFFFREIARSAIAKAKGEA